MKQFKIRCSQISQIMTNDRTGKEMGRTAYAYIDTWLHEQLYKRTKEFTSKFTDKGIQVEVQAMDFAADYLGLGLVMKNEQYFKNAFMGGTPDIILKDSIIDIKSSWDCFTFPLLDEMYPIEYWYQGQGYMHLTGRKKYTLLYVLMDTPDDIIYTEAQRHCYKNHIELDDEILNGFRKKMTYGNIDPKYRVKKYEFVYNPEIVPKIKDRVIQAREYINKRLQELNHKDEI